MPILDSSIFKERTVILAAMLSALQDAVPQAYVGEDGIARILFEIEAGQLESAYLAAQLLLEDVFPQTASAPALKLHGDTYGIPFLPGDRAAGIVRFTGAGGTVIPVGTRIGADPGGGIEPFPFVTTEEVTIPNPGTPDPCDAVVNAAAGNLNGTYEYVITFTTEEGETEPGHESDAVSPSDEQVDLSNIPLGGPGTETRKIYRQKNGAGDFLLIHEINDNTTTDYTDNIHDDFAGPSTPPETSTAERVSASATAAQEGTDGNVQPGTITLILSGPSGLTDVTNTSAFVGGTNQEEVEHFRQRLLQFIRNPRDGSKVDYQFWAEEVDGVQSATVYENDNLGTPTFGHVTVRISGPDGIIPDSDVVDAVQEWLDLKDVANITVHVGTFSIVAKTIAVEVTLDDGFTLDDVEPSVQAAIINYVDSIDIGGTFYVAGLIDAIFGLPGIIDVSTSETNDTAGATEKFVTGVDDITVTEAP